MRTTQPVLSAVLLAAVVAAGSLQAYAADETISSPPMAWPASMDGRQFALTVDPCSVRESPSNSFAHQLPAIQPLNRDQYPILTLDVATSQPGHDEDSSDAALAKKLANPIANLISVPFQYNADFNGGVSGHAQRSYLNIQPVIPISLNKDWNLITRTIVPVIYQEEMAPGQGSNYGLGDTTASFFFSPKQLFNGWIWGVGPVAYLPTATDTALGGGRWGGGITGVALKQEHGWTYGMLANHIWAGPGDSDNPSLNATFLQPFLSYTWPTATTLSINTESTYDWNGHQWTIPINLLAAQVLKIGGLPVQFQFGPRYYAEGPSTAPEWGLRFTITLLFPK